jgi:gluconolactonase
MMSRRKTNWRSEDADVRVQTTEPIALRAIRGSEVSDYEKLVTGFTFAEGPVWDAATGTVVFVDPADGGIWRLETDGSTSVVIPHRKGIGGLALHEDGGWVFSGRNLAYKADADSPTVVLAETPYGLIRFNDLGTDLDGRVYVGSVDYPPNDPDNIKPGALHVVQLDGSTMIVDEPVTTANGVGVSPDGTTLYFADTGAKAIFQYDHQADGMVTNRRPLIVWGNGGPDGIAVAEDGSVWAAFGGAGRGVVVVNPDGSERARLAHGLHITSLCFGGDDLRTVYMTAAASFTDGTKDSGIASMPSDVPGLPVTPARVAIADGGE